MQIRIALFTLAALVGAPFASVMADDEASPKLLDELEITAQAPPPLPCLGCDGRPEASVLDTPVLSLLSYLVLPAEPPTPDFAAGLAREVRLQHAGPDLGRGSHP